MKKCCLILLLTCLLLFSGCKKKIEFNNFDYGKIDYYVMGLYLEIGEQANASRYDANPKMFFDFAKNPVSFFTSSGSGTTSVIINNQANNIKTVDGVNVYHGAVNLSIRDENLKKIKFYPMYLKNGQVEINKEVTESFDLSNTSYEFLVTFTNNNQKYKIEISLLFKKEG